MWAECNKLEWEVLQDHRHNHQWSPHMEYHRYHSKWLAEHGRGESCGGAMVFWGSWSTNMWWVQTDYTNCSQTQQATLTSSTFSWLFWQLAISPLMLPPYEYWQLSSIYLCSILLTYLFGSFILCLHGCILCVSKFWVDWLTLCYI